MSANELSLLSNAIGEALQAVGEWEFDTRLGMTTTEAAELRAQIKTVLRSTPPDLKGRVTKVSCCRGKEGLLHE